MKPPILSDEELRRKAVAYFKQENDMDVLPENMDLGFLNQELKSQYDALVAYYEPLIEQEGIRVAREIFIKLNSPCPHFPFVYRKRDCGICSDELESKYTGGKQK